MGPAFLVEVGEFRNRLAGMRNCLLACVLVTLVSSVGAQSAVSKVPPQYKNCTALNKKYPHGVGKANARDHTSSGDPVTNFKRSTKIYLEAISFNKGLDRDKDGIACEN
jgi:Excalibur calcium-binding domain